MKYKYFNFIILLAMIQPKITNIFFKDTQYYNIIVKENNKMCNIVTSSNVHYVLFISLSPQSLKLICAIL